MANKNDVSQKKPIYKKWWFWLIVILVIYALAANDDEDEESTEETVEETEDVSEETESHIYDNAEVRDVINGTGDTVIGEFSFIEADSSEITIDVLEDWYFNYVEENEYNWCVILYSDYDDNSGVYSVSGFVEVGVIFSEEDDGEYLVADSENSILYVPSDGSLVEMVYDEEDEEISSESEETETEETSDVTLGMSNALKSAQSYLRVMAFSYSGLIEQLEFEGYTTEEATYAADNCGADWYEQAVASAESYLAVMSFSRSGLIEQLEFDGYTSDQAEYAATEVGY